MLTVILYTKTEDEGLHKGKEIECDYVSLVNSDTYGPPPLVAPDPRNSNSTPVAREGESVVYINTDLVPAFVIEREYEN